MQSLMKNEWNKIKLPFKLTILLAVVAVCITTSVTYKQYDLEEQLEVYEVGFTVFNLIFPLLAVAPTAWLMYFERKTHFIKYTLTRVKQSTYIMAKALVCMGIGFVIVFSISLASVIVAVYIVPPITQQLSLMNATTGELLPSFPDARIFGEMFMNQPFLYGFVLSIWKGGIGALIGLFGFVLSVYSRNLFVIITGPFLYIMVENFILSFFRMDKYRLITAFEPSLVNVKSLSWHSFVIGPVVCFVFIICYVLCMRLVRRQSVFVQ